MSHRAIIQYKLCAVLVFFVACAFSQNGLCQRLSIHVGNVVPSETTVGAWAVQVVSVGCDLLLVPELSGGEGEFLRVNVNGSQVEVQLGYLVDGIFGNCPTPENAGIFVIELGFLAPGAYQLDLVGVTISPAGTDFTDLGSFGFLVPFEARQVPAPGWKGLLALVLLAGVTGTFVLGRRAGVPQQRVACGSSPLSNPMGRR